MSGLLGLGRLALVSIFIYSGTIKLMAIGPTADYIVTKVTLPPFLAGLLPPNVADYALQIQAATGMTVPQWLAVTAGVVEVVGGLMIAANIGLRVASFALIVFTALATYYFHDFWNLAGDERTNQLEHVLKNLSIVGGLLILFALGKAHATPAERPEPQAMDLRY